MSPLLALPRSVLEPGRIDDTVGDILLRPEFRDVQGSWLARLRRTVQDWIFERVAELFSTGAGTVLAWVLMGAAVAGAVWFGIRMIRSLRGTRVAGETPDVTVVQRSAADWGAEARASLAAGDVRGSLRASYRWMVASLVRRGVLEHVDGRTVREYQRDLDRAAPELVASYESIASPFEQAWYADHKVSNEEAAAVVAVASGLADGQPRGEA